jgi:hypothetical protein
MRWNLVPKDFKNLARLLLLALSANRPAGRESELDMCISPICSLKGMMLACFLEELRSLLKNMDFLFLAEWLLDTRSENKQHFLFELIEQRYAKPSTV